MKVRVELEVDLSTGTYDIEFHNLSNPGDAIDLERVNRVVIRVLDNIAGKSTQTPAPAPRRHKSLLN